MFTEAVVYSALINVETSVSVSVEALVALAEIRADDVATPGVGVTPVTAQRTLVLVFAVCAVSPVTWSTNTLVAPKRVLTHPLTIAQRRTLRTFIHIDAGGCLGSEARLALAHKAAGSVHTHISQLAATLLLEAALVHIYAVLSI